MGYAIAHEAAEQGAEVILISGPTNLEVTHPAIQRINVVTAEEMHNAAISNFPNCDIGIMSAAVADFTPLSPEDRKVKRGKENYAIELTPTKDIAATLGKLKTAQQKLIGFALETNDETANAQLKLKKKNLDFIVLNSLNDKGAGFQHDTNKITIINNKNKRIDYDLKPKSEVAKDIVSEIIQLYCDE